ncbi:MULTISPECIES: ImmA/IrrE family metallo-endopeptidase [Glutamicibacter]|uniref:ImmA/IrrE family metallo-endopeptidase n=1 Tax=Glutamicibacter bergerei TaxID=256702 RepID=A0ABV9MSV2_9MICC|nr:DNA-binding protein [Micrococcaceae bacterium]
MSTFRVPVQPSLFAWAIENSGKDPSALYKQFKSLPSWESGEVLPTYKQLEDFAAATYTPFGDFFLKEAPTVEIPIPDFRTIGNRELRRPTPDLLETIFISEQRQEWYRNHALSSGAELLSFVGSLTIQDSIYSAAESIREQLQFTMPERRQDSSWTAALRRLIDTAEEAGILVMVSGIVGLNTSRPLNPDEFRGFALADSLAPLVFVNGTDTKAAQIFTLVHEICHLWLGQTALTDSFVSTAETNETELWCNRVAAEVLVPKNSLIGNFEGSVEAEELERLARIYKVSTLAVLKSIYDANLIPWEKFLTAYDEEYSRIRKILSKKTKSTGGDFYNTHPLRVSRRFAKAVINDTKTGRTLHRDAYRLLGTKKYETFAKLGEKVGVN